MTTSASGFVTDGEWHHVTATRAGDNMTLMLDGVEVATSTASVGLVDPAAPLTIGGEDATVSDYEGMLDDVRVYTRALTTGDVQELRALSSGVVIASDDVVTTPENTPIVLNPTTNDYDPIGGGLIVSEFSQPTNGTVIDNGDGTLTYTPNLDYEGVDSFDYASVVAGVDLAHHWGLAGSVSDSVGGAHGTVIGATAVPGELGGGLSFDEVDDHVFIPGVTYGSEFTISFEFEVSDNSGTLFQYLYSHGDINSVDSVNIFLNEASHGTDPNVFRTVIRDGDDTLDNAALQFDATPYIGTGSHTYTATAGSDGIKVYIDGVLKASDATRGTGVVDPVGNLYLGARQDLDGDRLFGGILDSVQIYDTVLSEVAISELNTQTNAGTVNITVGSYQKLPAAQQTSEDGALVFNDANGNAIEVSDLSGITDSQMQVTLSVEHGTLTLSQLTGIEFVEGDQSAGRFVVQGSESDLNAALDGLTFEPHADFVGSVTLSMQTSFTAGLEGHFTFDGGNADDQSAGPVRNGVLVGNAATAIDVGRGEVLQLDGVGDSVSIDGVFGEPSDVTLAAWVNLDSGRVNNEVLSLGNSLGLRVDDLSEGLLFYYYTGAGNWEFVGDTGVDLDGAGWHHIAVTFDDTNDEVTLYLDGVAVTTVSTADSISYTDDVNISQTTVIGGHANGSSSFDFGGQIDDARVYTRALSTAEIQALAADAVVTVSDDLAITVNEANDAPTFAMGDGVALPGIESLSDYGMDVEVQADGKYIVLTSANRADSGQDLDFVLTRYNPDGSLDTTFGTDGVVVTAVNTNNEAPKVLKILDDGKILVAGGYVPEGTGTIDSIVMRYDSNGVLDTTFSGDGMAEIDFSTSSTDMIRDMVVQPDGKVVVVGYGSFSGVDQMTVARLNTDGSL